MAEGIFIFGKILLWKAVLDNRKIKIKLKWKMEWVSEWQMIWVCIDLDITMIDS